jgi:hypothetical protein
MQHSWLTCSRRQKCCRPLAARLFLVQRRCPRVLLLVVLPMLALQMSSQYQHLLEAPPGHRLLYHLWLLL